VELRHLRYFIAVADELHVGRAAEKLRISQPALSQQVIALEEEIGTPLLLRHSRGVSLTSAGLAFLEHARDVLARVRSGVEAAKDAAERQQITLNMGLPETKAAVLRISRALTAFVDARTDLRLQTSGLPWLEQVDAVKSGKLDLGFCWTGDEKDPDRLPPGLSGRRLIYDPGEYALIPVDHPLAALEVVTLEDLHPCSFGIYERELHPQLYDHLMRHLRLEGLKQVETAKGVTSAAGAVPLVLARNGWTFVSRLVGQEQLPGVVARKISGVSVPAGIEVIWRAEDTRRQIGEIADFLASAVPTAP
jgi:DNA-binding transcriptional LysR family regulator